MSKTKTRPTTVRFQENIFEAIEYLKDTNKTKFGGPTTSQIIDFAIQLVVCEHAINYDPSKIREAKKIIENEYCKQLLEKAEMKQQKLAEEFEASIMESLEEELKEREQAKEERGGICQISR